MRSILVVIVVGLVIALWGVTQYGKQQYKERVRLEANQRALLQEQRSYKVRDSLNSASVEVLTLKIGEFKKYFGEINSLIKDMGVRVKRVESVSQNTTQSDYKVTAPVVDTLIRYSDTTALTTASAINYYSPHIEMKGVIVDSVFHGEITTFDTLTQIIHRVPRKFLFIKYGTKEIRQEIVSSNPHSQITYSKTIDIKRNRGR